VNDRPRLRGYIDPADGGHAGGTPPPYCCPYPCPYCTLPLLTTHDAAEASTGARASPGDAASLGAGSAGAPGWCGPEEERGGGGRDDGGDDGAALRAQEGGDEGGAEGGGRDAVAPESSPLFNTMTMQARARASAPLPSRTNWTRLVPRSVLTGHVSSLSPYRTARRRRGTPCARARQRVTRRAGGQAVRLGLPAIQLELSLRLRHAPRPAPCAAPPSP